MYTDEKNKNQDKKQYKLVDNLEVLREKLSDEQISERSYDMNKLFQSAMVRESSHPQFDGMSYMKYNESNEMADISYLAPKVNKNDSRITSGITHEKDSSLVSFFINLNFEGTVRVFHKDRELYDVGVALTNWVRKSREDENYNEKRPILYRNYVAQGTAFAIEEYVQTYVPDKVITSKVNYADLASVKWAEKEKPKLIDCGAQISFIDGKKVFLEDIRQPNIRKQPGVYVIDYIPYEELEQIWGKNEMWKYVPKTFNELQTFYTQGSIYSDWIFSPIDADKCCVIKVYRPYEQRYQVYINTIPMLPCGFPLQAISPGGNINIAKGDSDLMNMFAYSKSEPAKTKIDQAVFDKILQNMLIKFQQSVFPPRGNLSGKILDSSVLMGGRVTSDLDPKDFPELIENPGITNSEFSFYQLIKEQIDSKTISSLLEGQAVSGDMTLGQYMDMQKKQMLKIGLKIDGILNWEKQMLELRTLNLIANGPTKKSDGSYENIVIDGETGAGDAGVNIIRFDEKNYRTSEDVFNEQNQYEDENGVPAEITYLNPELLKELLTNPEYSIKYEVIPVDRNNDKLAQMMFIQMITQAANIFGLESLQVENIKRRFAAKFGERFNDLFLNAQQIQIKQQEMMQQQMAQQQQSVVPPVDQKLIEEAGGGENQMANAMSMM